MLKKNYHATMWLPAGAKEYWSTIMYGESPLSYTPYRGEIIVAAYATFEDGIQVIGGVKKSDSPDFNIKFFTVLDTNGNAYQNYPIDCSDHEDFRGSGFIFFLNDDESVEYHLSIKEKRVFDDIIEIRSKHLTTLSV